jgi:hypothetical protein
MSILTARGKERKSRSDVPTHLTDLGSVFIRILVYVYSYSLMSLPGAGTIEHNIRRYLPPQGNRNTFSQASPASHSAKGVSLSTEVKKCSLLNRHSISPLRLFRRGGSVLAYMSKTYSDWFGRQVVLQIEVGESLVPLRGLVVNESNNALRFRLDGCWEVDIYKEMILRVETDDHEAFQLGNWEASDKAPGAARSDSMPMLGWNRVFGRLWSRRFSWQLSWKNIIPAGLAGSFLLVLALHMSVPGPIIHFARFICGYLGLVFCAVSLGCGVWVLIDSIRTQSHIFAKWSKLVASFLDWFRQPIHL